MVQLYSFIVCPTFVCVRLTLPQKYPDVCKDQCDQRNPGKDHCRKDHQDDTG